MSQINPFTHVVFQSLEAQRKGAVEKERQLRKARVLEKNVAAQEDALEHQVESVEEVQAVGDEAEEQKRRPKRAKAPQGGEDDDGESHIDLTA